MYPSVNHAFHNDTNGARFDQDSANLPGKERLHSGITPQDLVPTLITEL